MRPGSRRGRLDLAGAHCRPFDRIHHASHCFFASARRRSSPAPAPSASSSRANSRSPARRARPRAGRHAPTRRSSPAPLGTRGLSVATAEALTGAACSTRCWPRARARRTARRRAGRPLRRHRHRRRQGRSRRAGRYRLPSPASSNFAADMAVGRVGAGGARPRAGRRHPARRRGRRRLEDRGDAVVVARRRRAFRARWLVGCDGGRSTVRKLAGFEFAGTEPEFTAYPALVDVADPDTLPPGPQRDAGGLLHEPARPHRHRRLRRRRLRPLGRRSRWSTCRPCCAACPAPTSR